MSPAFPSATVDVWVAGSWTSELCDVSIHADGTNEWGTLTWTEENTQDEAKAYVRVDILASDGSTVLQADLPGISQGVTSNIKTINLNLYVNVKSVDIYIKFKLNSKKEGPIVSDIHLT